MSQADRAGWEMRVSPPATLQAVEALLLEFRMKCRTLRARVNFAAELLLREALTNAVVHGCYSDPGKQVRCALRVNGRRLLIVVEDPGTGFDWRASLRSSAPISETSGRGIEILSKYGDRIRYNDRGNAVAIIKRF